MKRRRIWPSGSLIAMCSALALGACGPLGPDDGPMPDDAGVDLAIRHDFSLAVDLVATPPDLICASVDCDPNNCGAQGHDCKGGACKGGRCQRISLWNMHDAYPFGLAIDNTDIYWTVAIPVTGGVMKLSKKGGPINQISKLGQSPRNIALDEQWAYYSVDQSGIFRTPKGGGMTETLFQDKFIFRGIVTDDSFVYATINATVNGEVLFRIPKVGGKPEFLANGHTASNPILDMTTVYWADATTGTLLGIPKSGGMKKEFVAGLDAPIELARDDKNLYWINAGTKANQLTDGSVMVMPLGGGKATTLAANQDQPVAITARNSVVYWNANGHIKKIDVMGGKIEEIYEAVVGYAHIAVDAEFLYWTGGTYMGGGAAKLAL